MFLGEHTKSPEKKIPEKNLYMGKHFSKPNDKYH